MKGFLFGTVESPFHLTKSIHLGDAFKYKEKNLGVISYVWKKVPV
jgi:hypothetical protein